MKMKPKRSLLITFQKMRIPDLGAIQRVGDLASTRAKLVVSSEHGGGCYYVLEYDHENIMRAIYVNDDGEPQAPKLMRVEEYTKDTSAAVLIEDIMATLDTTYQPEVLPMFRKRLKDEKAAREAKLVGKK